LPIGCRDRERIQTPRVIATPANAHTFVVWLIRPGHEHCPSAFEGRDEKPAKWGLCTLIAKALATIISPDARHLDLMWCSSSCTGSMEVIGD